MAGYPITLQLENKNVLIIGGGKVAARKATALLDAGAKVTILSPNLDESLQGLRLFWIRGEYHQDALKADRYLLVFVATDNPDLNRKIVQDAKFYTPLVNSVDDASLSNFHNMAIVERGSFTIGISSSGSSPSLLKMVKERVAESISDGLVTLGTWLGSLRSMAKVTIDKQEERQALYERIIASEVLALLEAGKGEEAKALFNKLVEEAL